jgi:asparagine synthetase B (glutamine-hydrolysing)
VCSGCCGEIGLSLIAGALCTNGAWAADGAALRIAQRSCRYAHLSAQPLQADRRFALFSVGDAGAAVPSVIDGDETAWVLGDLNHFERRPHIGAEDLIRPLTSLDEKLVGRWVLVRYDAAQHRLRVSTDRMGLLWLYAARVPGGVLFATDFGALAEEVGSSLRVNPDAVLWELTCGYSLGDATLFEQIELLPHAATVELGAEGVRLIERTPTRFGDGHAGLTRRQKFERLDEIYDATFKELLHHVGSSVTLSISAGNDSRYALALLQQASVVPKLLTFGHPESEEVVNATAVCGRIGLANELFPIPGSEWDAWQRIMRMLGNTSILQWSGWVEQWLHFVRSRGRNLMVGYLGDTLSGNYLQRIESPDIDWSRFFLEWNTSSGWLHSPLLRPAARSRALDSITAHIDAQRDRAERAYPFQHALHLNLYGRQRRWVGTQPNLLARAVLPLLPFYRNRVMEFWTNLPLEDLVEQNLYLEYARSRFTRLFPPPAHPVAALAGRVVRKAGRIARSLAGDASHDAPRPLVIDRNKAIMPNKPAIQALARSVAPMVADLVDVDGFCDTVERFDARDQAVSGHIIRAVNVFFLLSLALPAAAAHFVPAEASRMQRHA